MVRFNGLPFPSVVLNWKQIHRFAPPTSWRSLRETGRPRVATLSPAGDGGEAGRRVGRRREPAVPQDIGQEFLAGSFSAVSKRNFVIKYAFDSIFQALQDLIKFAYFAPLQSQNFSKEV